MHDAMDYLHWAIAFILAGFREGFAHVNAVLGILIAVVAAFMMSAWKRIWTIALGATIIHLIAEVMLPVLDNRERMIRLPPNMLEVSYWQSAFALYLGYLVVITVFFFIKTSVLPRSAGAH
jgi:cytochrome c biogenesis protein CcdA